MSNFLGLKRLIGIGFIFASCAGGLRSRLPEVDEGEIPKTATNYLTDQYKDIPGTKLSLIAPDSFTYDSGLGGWTSASKRSWVITSNLQGMPLMAAGIYKARLTDKTRSDALDGALLGEWDITMNARKSRLLKVHTAFGGDEYLQYVLFIGDSMTAYRVTGTVHSDELLLAPNMRAALLGTFFDAERQLNGNTTQTSASPCNCENDKK